MQDKRGVVGLRGVMKLNNFDEDLKYEKENSKIFDDFYEKLLPTLSKIERATVEQERQGIDKILFLSDGRKIKVQEKIRRIDYGDFLIEFGHKNGFYKLGWIANIKAHFIFYLAGANIYIVSVLKLLAWIKQNKDYLKQLKWVKAYNEQGNYWTYSKAVKWDKLDFVKIYAKN